MDVNRKISLLTLIGLILPFGNVWGSCLVKVPHNSGSYKFRRKLMTFEFCLTLVFLIISIAFNVKAISSGFDVEDMRKAAGIMAIHSILVLAAAIVLAALSPKFRH